MANEIRIHTSCEVIQDNTETVQGIMKQNAESPIMIRGEAVSIGTDFKQSVPDEGSIHRWSTLENI